MTAGVTAGAGMSEQSVPLFEGFEAIEALQEASELAGWDCEYRQLQAGPLEARTSLRQVGGTSLIHESASRRLEILAAAPARMVTVLVPASRVDLRINGRTLSEDTIILLAPGSELHTVSHAGAAVVSMHIPEDEFLADTSRLLQGSFSVRQTLPINTRGQVSDLRELMFAIVHQSNGKMTGQALASARDGPKSGEIRADQARSEGRMSAFFSKADVKERRFRLSPECPLST